MCPEEACGIATASYAEVVRRRLFWPLVAVGSVCLVLAGASFAAALFSDPVPRLPRGFATYAPTNAGKLGVSEPEIRYSSSVDVLGRTTSLSWSSDRGFLIAAVVFAAVGLGTYGLGVRAR
jgi:hypothetical protein